VEVDGLEELSVGRDRSCGMTRLLRWLDVGDGWTWVDGQIAGSMLSRRKVRSSLAVRRCEQGRRIRTGEEKVA
jgi:hypothetical protein